MLSNLPLEIATHIATFLAPEDIISLAQSVPGIITSSVYHHAFPDDETFFSHYDLEMFTERTRADVLLIGKLGGVLNAEVNYTETVHIDEYDMDSPRMTTPYRFDSHGDPIISVGVWPYACAVTRSGALWMSMSTFIGVKAAYELRRAIFHTNQKDGQDDRVDSQSTPPSQMLQYSESFLSEPYRDPHIVQLPYQGFTSALALDDRGMLWKKDISNSFFPFCVFVGDELLNGRVSRVQGPHLRVDGVGIVTRITKQTQNMLHEHPENPNGVRNGYRCFNGQCAYDYLTTLKNPTGEIGECIVADFGVFFLTPGGSLRSRPYHKPFPRIGHLPQYTEDTAQMVVENLRDYGPFLQIVHGGNRLGLLTTSGDVVELSVRENGVPAEQPKVFKMGNIVSVAIGGYHTLALTDKGEVFTWGSELHANGCMGLGRLEDAVKMEGVRFHGENLYVDKPVKVKLPGRAYAVYAATSQSAILVAKPK